VPSITRALIPGQCRYCSTEALVPLPRVLVPSKSGKGGGGSLPLFTSSSKVWSAFTPAGPGPVYLLRAKRVVGYSNLVKKKREHANTRFQTPSIFGPCMRTVMSLNVTPRDFGIGAAKRVVA
jgi:hypothetical protein